MNPIAYGVLSKRVVAWFCLCCRGRSKQRRNNQGDTVNIFTENLPNRNQRSSQNSKKLTLMATPARCNAPINVNPVGGGGGGGGKGGGFEKF